MKFYKKLILTSILATFIVVFLFSVYGERPTIRYEKLVKIEQNYCSDKHSIEKKYETLKIIGTRFEDDLFAITLPVGWSVSNENKSIVLTKDNDQYMKITIFEMLSDPKSVESYLESRIRDHGDVSIEDIVVGINSFTKMTSSMCVTDSATLYCVTSKGLLTIIAGMFNEPEVLVILGSLTLK